MGVSMRKVVQSPKRLFHRCTRLLKNDREFWNNLVLYQQLEKDCEQNSAPGAQPQEGDTKVDLISERVVGDCI